MQRPFIDILFLLNMLQNSNAALHMSTTVKAACQQHGAARAHLLNKYSGHLGVDSVEHDGRYHDWHERRHALHLFHLFAHCAHNQEGNSSNLPEASCTSAHMPEKPNCSCKPHIAGGAQVLSCLNPLIETSQHG